VELCFLFQNMVKQWKAEVVMALTWPIGAALCIADLERHRSWFSETSRTLEIADPCLPDVLDSDWKPLVRTARAALHNHRGVLGIHGPYDGLHLASSDRRVQALVAERLRQGLEFASELGASYMVIHSPFSFFGGPFVPHADPLQRADEIARTHATLAALVPIAEAADCTLVFETIFDAHPTPLLDLVQSFESPVVRFSLDVGHAFITHQRGGPSPDAWVTAAGALLRHVHLHDNDGHGDRHWRPGRGRINWYALVKALIEQQQRPHLILEMRLKADIVPGAAWLETLFTEVSATLP
jgi:sugar phosphate isomerase/epimerase